MSNNLFSDNMKFHIDMGDFYWDIKTLLAEAGISARDK